MSDIILKVANLLNSDMLWVFFLVVIVVFYLIIALTTWDIKKPLIYLGIPSLLVGVILSVIRFLPNIIPIKNSILIILNSLIKPLLITGIMCIIIGIIMIILYKILEKKHKEKLDEQAIYDSF